MTAEIPPHPRDGEVPSYRELLTPPRVVFLADDLADIDYWKDRHAQMRNAFRPARLAQDLTPPDPPHGPDGAGLGLLLAIVTALAVGVALGLAIGWALWGGLDGGGR